MAEPSEPMKSPHEHWKVLDSCTDCGECYTKDPEHFSKYKGKAVVVKQPMTEEEEKKVAAMANLCPVAAIKRD